MSVATPGTDRAPAFPEFLLDDVLDHLHLDDLLLSAMPVSTYWRARVISHPHYWSDASSFDVDMRTSVSPFMLRLSRAKAGPIWVHVQHEDPGDAVILELSRHLSHMTFLSLGTAPCYVSQALALFRAHPAPSLTTLHLVSSFRPTAESEFSDDIVVPVDLFASTAPLLEVVNLSGARLAPFAPSLANVTFLGYSYASPVPSPVPNVFLECPKLKKLTLFGALALEDPAFAEAGNWARLRQLSCNIFDLDTNDLPIDGVRRVICHSPCTTRTRWPVSRSALSVAFHLRHASTPYTLTLRSTVAHPERERWIMTALPETPPGTFPVDLVTALQHAPVVGRARAVQLGRAPRAGGPRPHARGGRAGHRLARTTALVPDSCPPRPPRLAGRQAGRRRRVVCPRRAPGQRLELNGVALDGSESWEDFPDVFSGCEARALTEIDDNR